MTEQEKDQYIIELRLALQDLMDVQDGPPLIRWAHAWAEAMRNAAELLSRSHRDDS